MATEWAPLRNFFFERLCAAEFHWFFVQGIDALMNGLYVPAVSSLLNGIEASLRITVDQVNNPTGELIELSPYKVLSNNLIKGARDIGMPTNCLAFPEEEEFDQKLESQKPNRIDVELVRQRNNICHGNILEFVNRDLGKENSFFTPVSLRQLSFQLLDISGSWAEQIGEYRKNRNLLHYDR
ncbi:hypothetical protein SD10_08520 [Spirosoma radiotolerans]|uniref:Uncharacterized protein n=1 Tax=Spirosoma radiotolerans TaxID=1379870 RepID=A0A0E4A115_9BACT|nr:hypothetical protein SD10_08520 [Spirosoma radiotolerans]